MKREYRRELSILRKAECKLYGDLRRYVKQCEGQIKKVRASMERAGKATDRNLGRIQRRRLILEGRLA